MVTPVQTPEENQTRITWEKPSGIELTTNGLQDTVDLANNNGWKEIRRVLPDGKVVEAKPKAKAKAEPKAAPEPEVVTEESGTE